MRLEAKDRLNPTMVAVATIANIKDEQLLIHFDCWTSKYDYWCSPDCVDVHPMGWCERNHTSLHSPKGEVAFRQSLFHSSLSSPLFFLILDPCSPSLPPPPSSYSSSTFLSSPSHPSSISSPSPLLLPLLCSTHLPPPPPPLFCKRSSSDYDPEAFVWHSYLSTVGAIAAPESLFTQVKDL